MMSRFVLALALSGCLLSAEELPKSQLIRKVVTLGDATQSYALYIPSQYVASRPWPIVYIFEPAARGPLAVEHFKEGAEKYGYIVVASNNSRNGPAKPTIDAMNAMFSDTHQRFALDEKRLYVAGMSGGARVATIFATQSISFAGVIAQSAAFDTPTIPALFKVPFFGTVGTDDFNFTELRRADVKLDSTAVPHRLEIFAGPHGWAPKELCAESLAWLDLQAMQSGRKPVDQGFIDARYAADLEKAHAAERAGDVLGAWLRYKSLAADYKGWKDVGGFAQKADELKNSKAYKGVVKAEENQEAEVRQFERQLSQQIRALEEDDPAAMAAVRVLTSSARKRAEAATDSGDRRTARWFLGETLSDVWFLGADYREKKEYPKAIARLKVGTLMAPERAELHYMLATCYALARKRSEAIASLKTAVEKGFKDAGRLEGDASFESLRGTAEYKAVMAELAKK